jgi:hypothetical protein
MATLRFQCPECGMGDFEIGLMPHTETNCFICLEERGRCVRLRCWEEEPAQARLRDGLLAA